MSWHIGEYCKDCLKVWKPEKKMTKGTCSGCGKKKLTCDHCSRCELCFNKEKKEK